MVCSCAGDGLIRIWDASTGQCLRTLVDEDRKSVTSVKFVPNGKFVLAWTLDNCVRLWNYVEGRCVKTYQGHVNGQFNLGGVVGNYSYDDGTREGERRVEAFVASGSEDGDIVAWDVSSKDILWRGKGHRDVVLGIDFGRTKEGKGLFVSGGKDRDVKIWLLEGDEAESAFFAEGQDLHGHAGGDADMDMDMDMDGMVEGPTLYGNGGEAPKREADENAMLIDGDTPGINRS